ncbi:MAG: alpha/beta hydrolase [Candidatus Moraniibacteriota bacterium]
MLEKKIIIDGLNINYFQSADLKENETVVFLHGWGSRAVHLRSIFEDLSDFIAVDLPGFGESELSPASWSVKEYASFLKSLLDKLEIKNPILVGHSFGGSVIIKYLAEGGSAKKTVLISASGIRKKSLKSFGYQILAKIFKVLFLLPGLNMLKEKVRKKFYQAIDSVDYLEAGKMTENYKKIIQDDLTDILQRVTIPTVLIWGEKDCDTPLWQGELMQKKISGSKLFIIPDAGHFSFIDQPENFKAIFLKQI